MKRNLSTRSLAVLVGVLVVVYVAAGYFLLVSPKKGEAARLDEEIATATAELAVAQATVAVQDDRQPIAVADIFRLGTAMPSAPDMPGILIELSRIAEETGIRLTSITPQQAEPIGAYYEIPVDVALAGSFYGLSDFLFRLRTLVTVRRGELHASGRLVSISSVDFSQGEAGFPSLSSNLKLTAFVYGTDVDQAAVPPPAETPPATTEGTEAPPPADTEAAGTETNG